jgi:hypothetical protein
VSRTQPQRLTASGGRDYRSPRRRDPHGEASPRSPLSGATLPVAPGRRGAKARFVAGCTMRAARPPLWQRTTGQRGPARLTAAQPNWQHYGGCSTARGREGTSGAVVITGDLGVAAAGPACIFRHVRDSAKEELDTVEPANCRGLLRARQRDARHGTKYWQAGDCRGSET